MTRKDHIIEEIHVAREAIARESEYDIERIIESARARQAAEGRPVIRHSPRKPAVVKRES